MDQSTISSAQPQNNVPPINQPDQTLINASSSSVSHKQFLTIGKIIALIICFLVIVLIGITASVAYASVDIPFLSQDTQKQIKLMYFAMPLTPKTPEQILLAASRQNRVFTTYNPDVSFSGNLDSADIIVGSLDLKISGPVDITRPETPEFDIQTEVGVNYGGTLYSASGRIRKIDEALYSKIDTVSDSVFETYTSFLTSFSPEGNNNIDNAELTQKITPIFGNWIIYDLSGLESEARDMLRQQEQEQETIVEKAQSSIEELLSDNVVLPEVVRLDDEDVEGVSTYHLQVKPSKEALTHLIMSWYEREDEPLDKDAKRSLELAIDSVDQFTVDAWFGIDDLILRKAAVTSSVSLAKFIDNVYAETNGYGPYSVLFSQTSGLVDPRINTSAALVLRDIGEPVSIETPSPVVTSAEYSRMLQEAFYDEETIKAFYGGEDIIYEDQTDMLLGVFDHIRESNQEHTQ